MKYSLFHKTRVGVGLYIVLLVGLAFHFRTVWLALGAVITGILILLLMKRSLHIRTSDERTATISGKAAGMSYAIGISVMGVFSLMFLFGLSHIPYLKSLGIIFSYLVCMLIVLYALLYRYYDTHQ